MKKQQKVAPGFFTWREAAAEYGISVRTLKYLAARGKLTRYKQPGRVETLLERAELERVLSPQPVSA